MIFPLSLQMSQSQHIPLIIHMSIHPLPVSIAYTHLSSIHHLFLYLLLSSAHNHSLIKQCAGEVDNILKTGSNVFNAQEKMFLSCVTITKNGYLEPAWRRREENSDAHGSEADGWGANSGKQKSGLGRTCRTIPWAGRTIQANRECEILTLYSKIMAGKSTLSLCAKKRSSDHEDPTVLPLGL